MADVNINKFRASVVREGSKPSSPGFIVSEGQSPTDPAGSGQNHLPVTIATAATGLSITDSQVLGGAGNVGQYIRGDGSLADFPESSGGGSSVSYYLNGSVAQGTIGGIAYKELNKVPILGAGTDFTINANGYIASFITDAGDPNLLEIPGGNWNFETYFSASSSGGSPSFYVELYKVNSGGTATLIASNSGFPELIAFGTNIISYFSTLAVPTTTLALTDRLAIRYYVTHSGRTITLHTEDNHLCQIVTTFTTGITALNGLTAQVQNFAVGTTGTDFAIASATATHTFNLPTASATNRGALSSADWSTFNNKQNALGFVPVPETRTITINGVTQDLSANRTYNVGTVTSVGLSSATSGVTIGSTPVTTSGTITLAIATASGSQNGLLSSADWTTFNSKVSSQWITSGSDIYYSAGKVAIGTSTPSTTFGGLDISSGGIGLVLGADFNANTRTNLTTKSFRVGSYHYTNSQSPFAILTGASTSTSNEISIGGGTASMNAATNITFITASNNTTITGTERMTINSNGNVEIGTYSFTSPSGADRFVGVYGAQDCSLILQDNVQLWELYVNDDFYINRGSTNVLTLNRTTGNVSINSLTDFGFKLDVNGTARFSDGTQGLIIRAYTATDGWGAIYPVGVTPSSSNYTLIAKSTNAVLNASTSVTLAVGDSGKLTANSTGISVTGAATFSSSVTANGNYGTIAANTSTAPQYYLTQTGGNTYSVIGINRADGTGIASGIGSALVIRSGDATNFPIQLATANNVRLTIATGGNVLIGTQTDNLHKLRVNGDLWVDGIYKVPVSSYFICGSAGYRFNNSTDAFNNFVALDNGNATLRGTLTQNASDERLKNNIEIIPNAIDKIKQLRGVTFKWNQDLYETSRTFDIGVIAQEVEQVLPNAVCLAPFDTNFDDNTSKSGQNYLTVYYEKLIPLLIEGIKELKQEIDTLKN